MTNAVLDLLKNMLLFGFYDKPNDLKDMIKTLLLLLNGMGDVTSRKEFKYITSKDFNQ